MATRVVIIGAAGMDYHCFNRLFRDNPNYEVLAFTMAGEQNLGTIEGEMRRYPQQLAGKLYPEGIKTIPEDELESFVKGNSVDLVVLAYSDLAYAEVMHKASRALSAGADFRLIGPSTTMIKASKPVIAVTAVRTGCGKSQTSRKVVELLKKRGYKVVAIREPMPYGDLVEQTVMRFATYEDLDKYNCTIEEREEYEPYIERGLVIYSGVDYEQILEHAEEEADVIVFDGGNNEVSFYVPDLLITVADPHRPGHEVGSYPGEVNARLADYLIINKEGTAKRENIDRVAETLESINPAAKIIHANSPVSVEDEAEIRDKRVLVVEDGPTLTHGNMSYGAGLVAAKRFGASEIVSPKPYLSESLKEVFAEFPQLDKVLPAMGYNAQQLKDLEETINRVECDVVVSGTPIDLGKIVNANKPVVRVRYNLEEIGSPNLNDALDDFERKVGLK
ncbi:cyclic 2,3-diphosphoglycerate synthase [archaeon]